MAGKIDLYDSKWIELVFRDRNKEYGAYQLRKNYARNAVWGIVLSIVVFTLSVSAPLIIRLISNALPEEKVVNVDMTNKLEEPPPIDKNQPETPPPPPPPPPLKSTIKFTPPVIKPDEDVPDETPPTQEQLQDVDAGTKTVEGDPNADVDLTGLEDGAGDATGEEDKPFMSVEQMPEFPGGENALIDYIAKNTKYPPMARENNIEGTVYVQFVVEKDGAVSNITVLRGIGGGCDQAAKDVIKTLPKFTPGRQNGRPVRVMYNVPVKFKLM